MNFWDLPLFTVRIGKFTIIDLLAASTNAFNGALLCRRASHYRNYTVVGIILIAFLGGIGGGLSRDVVLNKVPSVKWMSDRIYALIAKIKAFDEKYHNNPSEDNVPLPVKPHPYPCTALGPPHRAIYWPKGSGNLPSGSFGC